MFVRLKRGTIKSTFSNTFTTPLPMSYYHRYRPQQFTDLVGQDHIRQILESALTADRLSHAYLFCGTRGTGKTTTARLLAKAINCRDRATNQAEPCNSCELCQSITQGNCLDVLEIDAASNRGIDEIRQLQDSIRFKPQQAEKKIVIIDEAHMLTKEAFNALLKTLEEPPKYLLFILATTEAHKLPATILSRCQRFDFFTPTTDNLVSYLQKIASQEKIMIDGAAVDQLARLARGSFRDSAMLLEQVAVQAKPKQPISIKDVQELLGLPELSLINDYLTALATKELDQELMSNLSRYWERGGNASAFVDLVFRSLADKLAEPALSGKVSYLLETLTRIKQQMKQSPVPELPIMAGLLALTQVQEGQVEAAAYVVAQKAKPQPQTQPQPEPAPAVLGHRLNLTSSQVSSKEGTDSSPQLTTVTEEISVSQSLPPAKLAVSLAPDLSTEANSSIPKDRIKDTVTIEVAEQVPPAELPQGDLGSHWQSLLDRLIENSQSSLVAILRTAKPLDWQPPVLKIGVQFRFHADQLIRQKNRAILESTLSEILQTPVRIETDIQPANDLASVAEEIFS